MIESLVQESQRRVIQSIWNCSRKCSLLLLKCTAVDVVARKERRKKNCSKERKIKWMWIISNFAISSRTSSLSLRGEGTATLEFSLNCLNSTVWSCLVFLLSLSQYVPVDAEKRETRKSFRKEKKSSFSSLPRKTNREKFLFLPSLLSSAALNS